MKLTDMMKQAQSMQANLVAAQEAVRELEVEGEAGAGLVKVKMTGAMEVLRIDIDPLVMSEEKAMLEDLLAAAVNDAVRRAQSATQQKMAEVTAGLNLPYGFKMPF